MICVGVCRLVLIYLLLWMLVECIFVEVWEMYCGDVELVRLGVVYDIMFCNG